MSVMGLRRDDWGRWLEAQKKGQRIMTDAAPVWLQHLKALGQQQGYLTYAQVNESLPLAIVDPEEIEEIVEQLKRSGIRIVPT